MKIVIYQPCKKSIATILVILISFIFFGFSSFAQLTAPSIVSEYCGEVTYKANGSPNFGTEWYWQTIYNGSSTDNLAIGAPDGFFEENNYTITVSGRYYIREKSRFGWGNQLAFDVTVSEAPTVFNIKPYGKICPDGSSSENIVLLETQLNTSYQLYRNGQNYRTPIEGTGGLIKWDNLDQTGIYTVKASNSFCNSNMAGSTDIKFAALVEPGTIGINSSTICYNAVPPKINSVVNAEAGIGQLTYEWKWRNKGESNWVPAPGNNSSVFYQPTSLTVDKEVMRVAKDDCGAQGSNIITINVNDELTAGTKANNQTICYGSKPLLLTPGEPNNGIGGYSYQWQVSTNGGSSYSNISDATSSTYSPGNLTQDRHYRRRVISCGQTKYTDAVKLTVINPPLPASPSVSPQCNQTVLTKGSAPSGYTYYWQGTNSNGTSTASVNASNTYTATSNGTYYIRAKSNTVANCWGPSRSVSVAVVKPSIPTVPSISPQCNQTVLTKGSAPSGYTYYWQGTNSNGTSTASVNASNTYTATSNGTYYIRAKSNTVANCWGPSRSVSVTVSKPTIPVVPSVSQQCDQSILTKGSAPSGYTYYWQGTNSNGTSTASVNASNTYTATSNGTYYIRAKSNTVANCWGPSRSVSVTVSKPSIPVVPSVSQQCDQSILTKGSAPSGYTYYWQGTNSSGTSTASVNASNTYTVTSNGTYYIRAKSNTVANCWGPSRSVSITVVKPSIPTVPSISPQCNQTVLTKGSAPSGYTYYWQGTNSNGTSTASVNASNTYTATSNGTYYIRAKSNTVANCWGPSRSVSVTVSKPSIPVVPSVSQQCDQSILTKGSAPSGYTYYWQGTNSSGTSTASVNASNTYTVTSNGTYYIRAKSNTVANCWGPVRSISVTLNTSPEVTSGSNLTYYQFENGISLTSTGESPSGGTYSGSYVSNNTFNTSQSGTGDFNVTYTYTNAHGCSASATKTITVQANPIMTVDGSEDIVWGEDREITVDPGFAGYQWYKNGEAISGATTNVYTAQSVGEYYVRITAASGVSLNLSPVNFINLASQQNENFVQTITYKTPKKNGETVKEIGEVNEQFTYFDGLGRKFQTVMTQASPNKKDLISPVEYDELGRPNKNFLPYTADKKDGLIDHLALRGTDGDYVQSNQYAFYHDTGSDQIANTTFPYVETVYEDSPLSRPVAQYAPGEEWAKEGGAKAVTTEYEINAVSDSVIRFVVDGNLLQIDGEYDKGVFQKTVVTDENGNQSAVFTDAFGKTILKRNMVDGENFDTYYVYDIYDNLRFVIPPEAIHQLTASTGQFPSELLGNFVFQYRYDNRDRMEWKKVPGAVPVTMIYDDRDRLVLTQDGEQANDNLFSFTKYDALNRPIMTGEMEINNSIPNVRNLLSGEDWLQNYAAYETLEGDKFGYTSNSLPKNLDLSEIHTVTYYDYYGFRNEISLEGAEYDYANQGMENAFEQSPHVKGQVTGSLTRVLGSNEMLASINYYDERYRLVQNISEQNGGNLITTTNTYDFVGNVLETNTISQRKIAPIIWGNIEGVEIKENNRLLKTSSIGWNAGAISVSYLEPYQDGYVEFTERIGFISQNKKMIGLSVDNNNSHYNSITYALQTAASGQVRLWNTGSNIYNSTGSYAKNDNFRIARIGDEVRFYQNGVLLHKLTVDASERLRVDVSINNNGIAFEDVKSTFTSNTEKSLVSISEIYAYDHADRLMKVYHEVAEPINWQNLIGYEVDENNNLIHIGSDHYNNTSAHTDVFIREESNGFIEVRPESYSRMLFGLNDVPEGTGHTNMEFCMYTAPSENIYVYESGVFKKNMGHYDLGDVLRIIKKDGNIHYTNNGVILYTSSSNVTNDLYGDVTSFYNGNTITNAMFSTSGKQLMVSNQYNELGELITKNLHEDGDNFAQSVDYRYNIRGWLTHINHADLSADNANEKADLFGMELGYTDNFGLSAQAQYNGNIAAIKWGGKRNDIEAENVLQQNAYGYGYDGLNRITEADFYESAAQTTSQKYQLRINEYDRNGNIKLLQRRDETGSLLDDLTYDYANSGNQLNFVSDAGDANKGFKDGNTSGNDYIYDDNGNMISDANKDITSISYNNLNLPDEVIFENGNKIVYIYDASGIKQRQEVYENNILIKATDYIGSLILENDTLQFIQTAEGRVVPKTVDGVDKNEYQYHLKDHLGNVRTTFAVRDNDYQTDCETGINPYFDNYDQITRLVNPLKKSGIKAHRLTGGGTDIVGLMKSLYVSKGDKISAEVYGKYLDAQFTDEGINGAALINALVGMLGGGTVTGEGSVVQNSLNTDFVSAAMADDGEENGPKAYLNYILLDKNFNYLNSGFERLSESAADPGDGSGTHQRLSFEEILIEEDGYLMVFLSNESEQSVEVFWDDFRVDHHYNAVLQADDYYPFGLTFNSYKREFSKKNKMNTFQDQEYDEETGWVQFKWRNHQPELGRFFNVDPLAEDYVYNSPYAFSENQVTAHVELEGMEKAYRDAATGTIIPASDNIRHTPPAGAVFNNAKPGKPLLNVSLNVSVGLQAGARLNKKGGEVNFGSKEVLSASTQNGIDAGVSNETKSNFGFDFGFAGMESSKTVSSSTETQEVELLAGTGVKEDREVTTTTTTFQGSTNVFGVYANSEKTETETKTEGFAGSTTSTSQPNTSTGYSGSGLLPVGKKNKLEIGLIIKLEIGVEINE